MTHSQKLYEAAKRVMPGGVNSPVRAFKAVGGEPVFFTRGDGARIFDLDGRDYVDFVGSWGPMIVGHAHPEVLARVSAAIQDGLGFGAPNPIEVEIANLVCDLIPSAEMIRMVNSGTEASMTAIRLARGLTQRDKIVKFEGCYHGHVDSLLVKAGSGALTLGIPSSPGVPEALASLTLTVPYNDSDAVEKLFSDMGSEIAAVIVEPVAGNMNCVPPAPGFLNLLRDATRQANSILIFDEVMTGFRVALGGAQSLYGIEPDLTILGKIIGGGLPVGAIAGPRALMEGLAPVGAVYQAGTLSGNPVAMAAGLATLGLVTEPGFHDALLHKTEALVNGLRAEAERVGIAFTTHHLAGMFGLFFTEQREIRNLFDVLACDKERFNRFFHGMLERGVYFAPSAYEAGFVSSAHGTTDIERTLAAARSVFSNLAAGCS